MFCGAGVWLCDAWAVLKLAGILDFLRVQIVLFVHSQALETFLPAGSKSPPSPGLQSQHRSPF